MKSVKYSVEYGEKASRLELLVRFFWMIPYCFVSIFLSIIYLFAYMFQFLYILVLGKRHKFLHDWILKYMAYYAKSNSYFVLLTDERSPIIPED